MFLHIAIGQNKKKSMLKNVHFKISSNMMFKYICVKKVCYGVFKNENILQKILEFVIFMKPCNSI
jgi:hypothetical protein